MPEHFKGGWSLSEGVRYRVIFKYLGAVAATLAAEFLLTALAAMLMHEGFLLYAAISIILAAAGLYLYRRVPEKEVSVVEAASIGSISFLAASLVGALPFVFLGEMGPLDAWFESMSGYTTTGFSLIEPGSAPRSLLLFRALSQWLGGLGFIVITIGLLLVSGRSAVTFMREQIGEKVSPRISRHVQVVGATYAALTLAGILLLLAGGQGLFSAVCYTLSGVSTGGFAVHAGSAGEAAGGFGLLPFILIMGSGATGFELYYRSWLKGAGARGRLRAFFSDPQLRCLILMTLVTGVLLALLSGGEGRLLNGIFTAASAQTTTGYFTTAPSAMPAASLLVIIFSMFVGGAMGSTAGGIKLFRLIEFSRGFRAYVARQLYPAEVVLPGDSSDETLGKRAAREDLLGISYIVAAYAAFIFAGTVLFTWYGYSPLASLFEVTSAAGTVGLSAGVAGPALEAPLKAFLIFMMWAGRLEFIPLFVWGASVAARARL